MARKRSRKSAARISKVGAPTVLGPPSTGSAHAEDRLPSRYVEACRLAEAGNYAEARAIYSTLQQSTVKSDTIIRGFIENDLAALLVINANKDTHWAGSHLNANKDTHWAGSH
jgi:hypothetical protein